MILARQIMQSPVFEVPAQATIQEAALLMGKHDVGSVIVTENNQPVGIVTERDITKKVIAQGVSRRELITNIMSSPLFSSSPDAGVFEVAAAMNANNIKKIPVIDNGHVLGMITQTDFLQHLFMLFKQMHEAYNQGRLSPEEFASKSAELVERMHETSTKRNWHMRCLDCGSSFLNPERGGVLYYRTCPYCQSTSITYQDSQNE